jgi:hypothetical protein
MARVLLDHVLDVFLPRKHRRSATRRKIVSTAEIAMGLATALSARRSKFAAVQRVLALFFMPAGNDAPNHARRIVRKIKDVKNRLAARPADVEQKKLKLQLETLVELLTDNEEGED